MELLVAEILTCCVWLRRGVRLRNKFFSQFYRQSRVQDWRNSWRLCLVYTCMQSISPLQLHLHLHPQAFWLVLYIIFFLFHVWFVSLFLLMLLWHDISCYPRSANGGFNCFLPTCLFTQRFGTALAICARCLSEFSMLLMKWQERTNSSLSS